MSKNYIYKVYDSSDNFIQVLDTTVVNDFTYPIEINSPGSEVKLQLALPADDFGESTVIYFGHKIKVYAVDDDQPNGVLLFTGTIIDYTPSIGGDEKVEITLRSAGQDLSDYMIDYGDNIEQLSQNYRQFWGASGFGYYYLAQSFVLTQRTRIRSVDLFIESTDNIFCALYISDGVPTTTGAVNPLTGCAQNIYNDDAQIVTFEMDPYIDLEPGNYYLYLDPVIHGSSLNNYVRINQTTDVFESGKLYQAADYTSDPTGTLSEVANSDLWFRINASTIQPYNSMDPSDILRDLLDHYTAEGGAISYDADSIDDTGTTVSYTFNSNTTLEGVNKCLELAPVDWYWYVDPTTNLLHFHRKTASIDNTFVIGKDIINIKPEKRSQDIVNSVYFTGGGTPPLFKKYEDADSISMYGKKILKYIDQRVTNELTAETIATTILSQRKAPEVRLSFDLVDNNFLSSVGVDIESITIGNVASLRSIGDGGSSLWDVMYWDVDYWDYDITDLGTLILQIIRLEYSPDSLKVFCSTMAPDVNKRIEDINRNLENSQTVNNEAVSAG